MSHSHSGSYGGLIACLLFVILVVLVVVFISQIKERMCLTYFYLVTKDEECCRFMVDAKCSNTKKYWLATKCLVQQKMGEEYFKKNCFKF